MNIFSSIRPVRLLALAVGITLVGCASVKPMALDKNSKAVDVSTESVVLMTLDIHRTEPSRYVPNPFSISFEKQNASDKSKVQNFQLQNSDRTTSKDGHEVYILSVALEPGQYKLNGISGDANAFPFHGFFFVPLLMDIQIQKNAVTYIGRVKAELRPRQGNEFRAGSVIPLVDQAVTGMSTGTFDITVEDFSLEDIPYFQSIYPALRSTSINTALLPQFDRSKAQRWSDGDTNTSVKQESTPSPSVSQIAVAEKTK